MINELKIHCVYKNRGCQEIVQPQHFDRHEDSCGFTPVVCTNEGCGATVNKRDLIHHESEQYEYRKLKCHSCGEMKITLANVETKIANIENKMEKKIATIDKNVESMEAKIERSIADIKTEVEEKFGAVSNEVKKLKETLVESFDQMKSVLVKMEDSIKENTRKIRNTSTGDKDKIFVAGGIENDSAEIFDWSRKSWAPLQSMPEECFAATGFVHDNHVVTAGGCYTDHGFFDNMIRMKIEANPDLWTHWSDCPIQLPAKLAYHSSVVYKDHLYVSGGCIECYEQVSDLDDVLLVPPYTVKTLSRMPEPRLGHGMEIFGDCLLIFGGSTTKDYEDNLSSVVLYDTETQQCKQLAPLPYEVSGMAIVKWGDNIVVIGGADKDQNALDTVIMYNVKTEQSHMLPPMRFKRSGCTAVVVVNNIVVLGGDDDQFNVLKSVECFNFERYNWEELPEMTQERSFHTAVVV